MLPNSWVFMLQVITEDHRTPTTKPYQVQVSLQYFYEFWSSFSRKKYKRWSALLIVSTLQVPINMKNKYPTKYQVNLLSIFCSMKCYDAKMVGWCANANEADYMLTWFSAGTPIKFIHSISNTWSIGKMTYYRHKVILKNTSQKPVTDVKLMIENLQGPLWGLSPTPEKNTYELLQWQKVLQPASECTFVYIQGGPQAKISILSYHWPSKTI